VRRIAQRSCCVIGVADGGSAAVYPTHLEGWRRIPDPIPATGSCQMPWQCSSAGSRAGGRSLRRRDWRTG
jgi:hypothetical protein